MSGSPSAVSSRDYASPLPDYTSYIGGPPGASEPSPCDTWTPVVRGSVASVGSTVSSPASTANDEYGYMPTSAPQQGLERHCLPPTSIPPVKGGASGQEVDYDDIKPGTQHSRPSLP